MGHIVKNREKRAQKVRELLKELANKITNDQKVKLDSKLGKENVR